MVEAFGALSDSKRELDDYMISSLADNFVSGTESLKENDMRVEFVWHQQPTITVDGFYFTYGPFPPPKDYVNQDWLDFITYVVPKEDADFHSQPRQQEIAKAAAKEGCYIRIDTIVDCDLEFVVKSYLSDIPLLRDRRIRMGVSFMSPHFDPWDEIFTLQEDQSWKLRWNWKISDIDGVCGKKIRFDII